MKLLKIVKIEQAKAIRKATTIVEATMAACELYQKESSNEIVTPPT